MTAVFVAVWYQNSGEQVELKPPELENVDRWTIAQLASAGESWIVVVWKGSRTDVG